MVWRVEANWGASGSFDSALRASLRMTEVGWACTRISAMGARSPEFGVVGDFFDLGLGFDFGLVVAWEVGGGDLEAVEDDAAAFVFNVAAGEAGEDFVEGELDGGAVVDARHGEDAGVAGRGSHAAGTAVVETEALAAEGRRAAAVAFGEDVAADEAAFGVGFGLFGFGEGG